jgi:hypothetical protein
VINYYGLKVHENANNVIPYKYKINGRSSDKKNNSILCK